MKRHVSLAEVKASINPDFPAHFTVRWFGRPIGDVLTPAACAMGLSANDVTFYRTFIGLGGLAALIVPGPFWLPALAAAIFYLCFILDCVDGNIARLHDQASYWGKFMDGIADFVFVQGAPFAAGIGLWLRDGSLEPVILGACITIATLTSQMVRARVSFMREWMVGLSGPIDETAQQKAATPRRVQRVVGEIYVNGTFFAPLCLMLGAPDGVWAYLLVLVAVQLGPEIVWLGATFAEARVILDRHRRSKHAPDTGFTNAEDVQSEHQPDDQRPMNEQV